MTPTRTTFTNLRRLWTVADWPLAVRLTALYALAGGVTLALSAAALYLALARSIRIEQDNFLASKLNAVRALLRENSDANALKEEAEEDWLSHQYVQVYLRILSADGSTSIAESPRMSRFVPTSAFGAPTPKEIDEPTIFNLARGGGGRFPGVASRAPPGPDRRGEVPVPLAIDTTPH